MTQYKMVGLDVDSSFTQHRTWVVDGYPDFDGYYVTLKSGDNSLADVYAYPIPDGYIVDFNLINPLNWKTTYSSLPEQISDSQLAVIDGYVYLFGGKSTSKIFRATITRPNEWEYTGYDLPSSLYGSQLAIIDGYIYLFGGNNGVATDTIYSATVSNPLSWTNQGSLLPEPLYHSQLCVLDGYIYLFGGQNTNNPRNIIFRATTSNPLSWIDTGSTLPNNLYGSHIAVINNNIYLIGGIIENNPISIILRASTSNPLSWLVTESNLPAFCAFGQFITIDTHAYLFIVDDFYTKILKCSLADPLVWNIQNEIIPSAIYQSQITIIYDRLFLFGGTGNTAIFTSNYTTKYKYDLPESTDYADITRTQYQGTIDPLDLIKVIGFPYWKTNYYR